MNYSINSKNRKLKYKLHVLLDRMSFNFLNLSLSQKITLVWIIISFISLFTTWFTIEYDKVINYSSFSSWTWYVWYIILLICLITTFLILSNKNKEKIKSRAHIFFNDYSIIIFSSIIIFVLSFVIFNSLRWFGIILNSSIVIGKSIVFEFIGAIFIFIWWILDYRSSKNDLLNKIYIENSKFEVQKDLDEYREILWNNQDTNKSNMSLPI